MKRLDTKTLFDVFQAGDEEVYKEHGVEHMLDNSFVLLGTVVKGVENYYIIDQLYKKKYGEEYDSQRENIKLTYFKGLMKYLERIGEIQLDTLSMIEDEFGIQAIEYAFSEMTEFFLSVEYYEECSLLKKYLDLFSLNKLVEER
jgi:hypothetical protein